MACTSMSAMIWSKIQYVSVSTDAVWPAAFPAFSDFNIYLWMSPSM